MPESGMAATVEEALDIAHKIGYPVMVRPSYVLGGRGMEVVYDDENMESYMKAAVGVTPDRPILIDRFLNHATECEDVYKRQLGDSASQRRASGMRI